MDIDFTADDKMMGDVITPGKHNMKISICAADAIDRVELLKEQCPRRNDRSFRKLGK